MTTDVRTITEDDLPAFAAAMRLGFLGDPDPAAVAADVEFRRRRVYRDRTWAAFDGERCVGTYRIHPFELTVPFGRTLPAAGVTNVTVAPTHRRQGLLTRMMAAGLRSAADRGDPVSILIPSEWPIYGRYGYGPATEAATYRVDAPAARLLPPRSGTLDLVEVTELRSVAPAVYDQVRTARAGGLSREQLRWDADLGLDVRALAPRPPWRGYCVLRRDAAGDVDGYLRYHTTLSWDGRRSTSQLRVDELVAATPGAYADLWGYCLSVDLVAAVQVEDRPVDEPLPLLLADGRAVRQADRTDFIWLRLLDVPAALAGRGYPRADRLVLQVVDPDGYAAGRFALDASPDGSDCRSTGDPAELTLPAAALASVYLGGARLRTLHAAGQVDEHRPGAVAAADALFAADAQPWCPLWF
jgi:predicted acetyltransferase